jgi:hypothetical protein
MPEGCTRRLCLDSCGLAVGLVELLETGIEERNSFAVRVAGRAEPRFPTVREKPPRCPRWNVTARNPHVGLDELVSPMERGGETSDIADFGRPPAPAGQRKRQQSAHFLLDRRLWRPGREKRVERSPHPADPLAGAHVVGPLLRDDPATFQRRVEATYGTRVTRKHLAVHEESIGHEGDRLDALRATSVRCLVRLWTALTEVEQWLASGSLTQRENPYKESLKPPEPRLEAGRTVP